MDPLPGEASPGVALAAVAAIEAAFARYQQEFHHITARAKTHFEARSWQAAQSDAVARLDLYKQVVDQVVRQIRGILGGEAQNPAVWTVMKARYSEFFVSGRQDYELAETFFNSVTRRIFTTVGVDPSIEFVDSDFEAPGATPSAPIYTVFSYPGTSQLAQIEQIFEQILAAHPFEARFDDIHGDAQRISRQLHDHLVAEWGSPRFDQIEMLQPVFFRGQGAYLIGRVCGGSCDWSSPVIPLVLCLRHEPAGIYVDAVLMDQDEVSIVFSFTRSYFHVEVEWPHELILFLKSILPLKRVAELYISIGYNKHGKTELYRDMIHHLQHSGDPFVIAPGEKGMVMVVFGLESYDLVFKIIKDRADPPKTTTRQEVMERYELVFRHDRAGRLVDAQEFEHLRFDRDRFSAELLDELIRVAPNTVSLERDCVVIKHLYTERRMVPLNLYVRQAGPEAARQAVIDYGQAIKDLAATNIFPGDVLLKNFGVTRHGRVVFYDYDELCRVTDVHFRRLPQAASYDDEMEADPWFYVGPQDVFPEEFRTFLGLQEPLRGIFQEAHGDLFEAAFWKGMQARHKAGEVLDILPYPAGRRLRA